MMKKIAALLLCLMLTAATVAVQADSHIHEAEAIWRGDLKEHWQVCECGEQLEVGEHELEDATCSVCGGDVWVYDDGSGDVYVYDEMCNCVRSASFDEEGSLIYEYIYVYEYDGEGNALKRETYFDNQLIEEIEYQMGFFGYYQIAVQKNYSFEGNLECVSEYDTYGNIVKTTNFNENGEVVYEEIEEYRYDENGNITWNKTNTCDEEGYRSETVRDGYGNIISEQMYDEDGELIMDLSKEYGYDENGNMLWSKVYYDGVLSTESEYAIVTDLNFDNYVYEKTCTNYYEDGSRDVSEYNENYDLLQCVTYDADGNVVLTVRSEFGYNENGMVIWEKTYENDRLTAEKNYYFEEIITDSYYEVSHYMINSTEYFEDGSKMVGEYDHRGNYIKMVEYDADGNCLYEMGYEYGYDEEDYFLLWTKDYYNGVLVNEATYYNEVIEYDGYYEEIFYRDTFTEYAEDGTVTVTELDEDGEIISQKAYDADGNEIELVDAE